MDSLTKALSLYEIGCWVFPSGVTEDGTKFPHLENGHLGASNDPEQITLWFTGEYKDAHVAVHAGRSGLVLLDRDVKDGIDGFQELEDSWLLADETFGYRSVRGKGRHDVYIAPENVVLNGQAGYRGMPGVDRRGGSSWWVWAADEVPDTRDAFAPAPEWLCDPARVRSKDGFEGGVEEWVDSLVAGDPNVLVQRAIERIPEDMSHSEMVEQQYNAVRLGAEGAPGVKKLLHELQEAWLSRPEEAHTTPRDKWEFKFNEALERGINLYGAHVERIQNLPEFHLKDHTGKPGAELLVGAPGDKYHFSKVLNGLVERDLTDDERASVLWNAPTTKDLSRQWGIDFVYERIAKAHKAPEPERENPQLEEIIETNVDTVELMTPEERGYIAKRPTFVQHYMEAAKASGLDNEVYARSGGWRVASMAFAFRGFIPQGPDKKMGVNLWNITMGHSGTGKTTALEIEEAVYDVLFKADNPDGAPYHTGSDTSPQGLHLHLLERDRKPTVLIQDEASVFFQSMKNKSWVEELTHSAADWYNGRVRPSSKINLKEFRGKSALTSFHMAMMGTPDKLLSLVDDSLFSTGFLARVLWDVAPPATEEEEDRKYEKRQYDQIPEDAYDAVSPIILDIVTNLVSAARMVGATPKPILADRWSLDRMKEAHKRMGRSIKGHPKWAILEPSVTRLGEDTLRKCAALCAMYRGDTRIRKDDTLHAIHAVEIWFNYLLEVVDKIQQGEFQVLCNDIEFYIHKEKSATETRVLNTFRNRIKRDPRELNTALQFLVSSGRVNREDRANSAPKYSINGGK